MFRFVFRFVYNDRDVSLFVVPSRKERKKARRVPICSLILLVLCLSFISSCVLLCIKIDFMMNLYLFGWSMVVVAFSE